MAAEATDTAEEPLVSLYVGDLHHDVTDSQLYDAFSEVKTPTSVRVCRDSSSGRSFCYGYVNYMSLEDALCAMEAKNHSSLNGKTIRVMWSVRDPEPRRSGIGNVFVKNLSDTIDNAKLQEIFQNFGTIVCCKVSVADDGKSRGYGFVQFESEDSANAAIEELNGFPVEGKQIHVSKFVKKSDRVEPDSDAKYTNLYMKNLDPEVTEEELKAKFSEFGEVLSLAITKDDQGVTRGFGFVNFDKPDDAKRAMEVMNGSQLGSKILYVARAQKKSERQEFLHRQFEERREERIVKYQDSNTYVKNISDDVTDDQLRELFSPCGTIISAKVMRDNRGINKGFGFVCFSNPNEAIKAVETFHGFMFHRKPLYVAIAQKKEERRAQLQMRFACQLPAVAGPPSVISGVYPPFYYPAPRVVPQLPGQPGLMCQPLRMQPGWRPGDYLYAARPAFQPPPVPLIHNNLRQHRQNWGRINGNQLSRGGSRAVSYLPHMQQSNQQRGNYTPSRRAREMNMAAGVSFSAGNAVASVQEASVMLSSRLVAAPLEQQKQILGESLYPLVRQYKPDRAEKITGMLLEMDNSELLLLLESPESLVAKVEEAVEVLNLSNTSVSSQEAIQQNYLSSEVAVN